MIELPLADAVCLALVAEAGDDGIHGWAVAGQLLADTAIGRIWSLSRPLAYRSLDRLIDVGLLERAGNRPGRGPRQNAVRITPSGRQAIGRWLATPVEHLRDARTELLLKLELTERSSGSAAGLLAAQRGKWSQRLDNLEATTDPDTVARWRREQARAIRHFLDTAGTVRDYAGDLPHPV